MLARGFINGIKKSSSSSTLDFSDYTEYNYIQWKLPNTNEICWMFWNVFKKKMAVRVNDSR